LGDIAGPPCASTRGFGVTNLDHPLPVTADTLFQVGSITKTFTGTVVLQLVE
jgi:CubicO group peptidase (beta-lactamase class C family)